MVVTVQYRVTMYFSNSEAVLQLISERGTVSQTDQTIRISARTSKLVFTLVVKVLLDH